MVVRLIQPLVFIQPIGFSTSDLEHFNSYSQPMKNLTIMFLGKDPKPSVTIA